MAASFDIRNTDLVALAQTLWQLRSLARELAVASHFPDQSSAMFSDEDRDRATKAALAIHLYLDLCRAAMQLVGNRYFDTKIAGRGTGRARYIQRQLGLAREGALMTLEVGNVLPLIGKATWLMDRITSLACAASVLPPAAIENSGRVAR